MYYKSGIYNAEKNRDLINFRIVTLFTLIDPSWKNYKTQNYDSQFPSSPEYVRSNRPNCNKCRRYSDTSRKPG